MIDTETDKLIKNLNHNKSLGPCSIPVKILKNHANDLKQPLAFLINLSFRQGVFPEALKTARVAPIFKNDNPQIPSNYALYQYYQFLVRYMKNRCNGDCIHL